MSDRQPIVPQPRPHEGPRLGYFVVRARRLPGSAVGEVTGVVERLGTAEKRSFRSSAELTHIIEEWSGG